jgi:hypothetical protein
MVPGARAIDTPRDLPPPAPRDIEPPRAPAPDKVICETLDRCTLMMQMLEKRLCDVEGKLQAPQPAPVVPPIVIQPAPGPRCFPSLFSKPHLPCLGSICDKP